MQIRFRDHICNYCICDFCNFYFLYRATAQFTVHAYTVCVVWKSLRMENGHENFTVTTVSGLQGRKKV